MTYTNDELKKAFGFPSKKKKLRKFVFEPPNEGLEFAKQNKRWKNFKYQQTKLQMLPEVEKLKLKMLSMILKESDFQRNSVKIKIAVHFLSIFLHQNRNLKYFFFHNFPCIFPNIF